MEETICPVEFKVESDEERKTWYYSSPKQFDELLKVLEKEEFEKKLFQVLKNLRPEILKQMTITVQLTNEQKGEWFCKQFKPICFTFLFSLGKRKSYLDLAEKVGSKDKKATRKSSSTRPKTGTITIRTFVDLKQRDTRGNDSKVAIKEEIETSAKSKTPVTAKVFKLGMRHDTYVNQYSSNPLALDKKQTTEKMDKLRYLSLKFSSTGCNGFQWPGRTFGTRTAILKTLQTTLLQLHSQLPAFLIRPNWPSMRQSWITAVRSCVSAVEFGRLLSVLAANIRPVVFTQVWHTSLGHIRIQRQTAVEKKGKYEKELEEEMHRLHVVHFTKGLKHSVRNLILILNNSNLNWL